jgi:hypothetical protein
MWQLTPNIRGMVKYRQVNLISDFPHLGMFDLIFCRNVLIYFDQQTKVDLLDRLAQVTAADGYLVLGAAETVVGLTDSFTTVPDKRGLYAPNPRLPLRWAAAGKPGLRLVAASGGSESRRSRRRIGRGRDADALGANALGILSVRAARSAVSIPGCEERLRASKNPGRLAGVLKTWR